MTSTCIYIYIYIYVTPPGPHTATTRQSGSRTRDSSAGGGRSNKERQRLQPLASVARAPLFWGQESEVLHTALTGIATSVTLTPLNLTPVPGFGTNVTPPGPHTATTRQSGSRTRDSGAGGQACALTRNAKGYSLYRQSLERLFFEARRVRFYTQPLLA